MDKKFTENQRKETVYDPETYVEKFVRRQREKEEAEKAIQKSEVGEEPTTVPKNDGGKNQRGNRNKKGIPAHEEV